jgi:hypothetical protein
MSVTSITRHQPAKPVTTAEVLDACAAAVATDQVIRDDLAELVVQHLRHVMNLSTIPAAPAKPVLRPLALLDVAQADSFLLELDDRTRAPASPRPCTCSDSRRATWRTCRTSSTPRRDYPDERRAGGPPHRGRGRPRRLPVLRCRAVRPDLAPLLQRP